MSEDFEKAVGPDRRTFVTRLVIGTAFATPVVSSFTMSGVQAVFGSSPRPITGASNGNTTGPQPPAHFTEELICGFVSKGGLTLEVDDGAVAVECWDDQFRRVFFAGPAGVVGDPAACADVP